jgi:predicted DNA-binding transcriptional regulator AlpA
MAQAAQVDQMRTLLKEQEAADVLGLSQTFLQKRRREGGGPKFVRLSSRAVRYRPEDLQAWVADRLRTSTSDQGR